MEKTIVDNSATPAKCELLARLQLHNKFVVPSEDEIAAAIDAARANGLAAAVHFEPGDDDDELVEAVPVPVPAPAPADGLKTLTQAARKAPQSR